MCVRLSRILHVFVLVCLSLCGASIRTKGGYVGLCQAADMKGSLPTAAAFAMTYHRSMADTQ